MVGDLLKQKNLTVATAESCTGGLLASRLTDAAGSSAYVKGGVVAYTNEIKNFVLHVDAETLKNFGAVSSRTAREMATNVRKLFSASIGVSTTGVAGPDKSEGKSVGTVFIAVDGDNFSDVREFHFTGTRTEIKAKTVNEALNFLTACLT